MEAALTHSSHDWNLFLAVDLPFLPAAFVYGWASRWLNSCGDGARIRLFSDGGHPHPSFCLLHKDVLPFLAEAIGREDFKLMRIFQNAGRELATRQGFPAESGLWFQPAEIPAPPDPSAADWPRITPAQLAARELWFANLNTPDDFARAQAHVGALDT
jgi:molybdopterin-guanine dinucleotide biosynthesis protein A